MLLDVLWIAVSNTLVGILAQRDDITEDTLAVLKPKELVFMGGVTKDAGGRVARTLFLDNFSESDIQLSLATEQPIFKRVPHSFPELISWPQPVNEVQNRMHAGIATFIHFPLIILLPIYANWKWYPIIPLIGTTLRFSFAYRFDPQSWLVLYVSRIFDPIWVPGAPKRFAAMLSVCMMGVITGLTIAGYNTLASWITVAHLILSYNQALGWCMGCGMFFLAAQIGLVPKETCKRCMMRFVPEANADSTLSAMTQKSRAPVSPRGGGTSTSTNSTTSGKVSPRG